MRKSIILLSAALLISALSLQLGCTIALIPPPPPLREEVVVTAPVHGAVWVRGHWKWRRWGHQYVWVPGYWHARRHGVWVIVR